MARNPFKLPGLQPLAPKMSPAPGVPGTLPSDRALNPKPNLIGPEQPMDPEARKARFRKLAGILGGLQKP